MACGSERYFRSSSDDARDLTVRCLSIVQVSLDYQIESRRANFRSEIDIISFLNRDLTSLHELAKVSLNTRGDFKKTIVSKRSRMLSLVEE